MTRQELNLGIAPVARRERAAWNLELGRTRAAKRELESLIAESPDEPRIRALLSDERLAR